MLPVTHIVAAGIFASTLMFVPVMISLLTDTGAPVSLFVKSAN